ncbi:MAG TPA: aldo/keto reductase [Galbitalea sp.]|jgi:aryl-alcohol dehydrogenase-like predicted oxidoreductase
MTNLDFGPLVLGGNTFGWTSDKDESFAVLDRFVDAGGRSVDTADVYGAWVPGNKGGESEEILGAWLKSRGHRDRVVIATKVFSLATRPGLSAGNIRSAVDDSLKRLQTDYLDLYYAHRDDESVSQVEYMGAFNELVEVGKVREIGASNFTYDRLTSANTVAKEVGHQPFTVAQDRYNLIERGLEEVLNHLDGIGVTELPYAALAGGFLTGKYRAGIPVESARAGNARKYLDNPRNITLLGALDVIAAAHGVSVTAVSLAWLRQQHGVGAPIASARTTEQLEHLIESFELFLTNDELASLS